jgi:hypothetical protein
MIDIEFKEKVVNILKECIFNIEAATDEHEHLMLIGILEYITRNFRILSMDTVIINYKDK